MVVVSTDKESGTPTTDRGIGGDQKITALNPNVAGWQFVIVGDSCSGVPGHLHEKNLSKISRVIRRLRPLPQAIIFPGDEILGLVTNESVLRKQWSHFLDEEMAWVRELEIPLYHSTGNHTTYSRMSERVFSDVMQGLPRNGALGQEGLSYYVRKNDLLIVFVHTLSSELGGEGHLELEWLQQTLEAEADARFKFVVGHHPAHTVNGYAGTYQRCIGDEYIDKFWSILVDNSVIAYLCSHILAFDVQCHSGVLQITSAGAGTNHRMPEGAEYLHCVQVAVDETGLRYQVLDDSGNCRESLVWPPDFSDLKNNLTARKNACLQQVTMQGPFVIKISGQVANLSGRQTILCGRDNDGAMPLWIGLVGHGGQLTVALQPQTGRSPHQWLGPKLECEDSFELELLVHPDMGPGGFLWRPNDTRDWTGLTGFSSWGAERLSWPLNLWIGQSGDNTPEPPFAGGDIVLEIRSA